LGRTKNVLTGLTALLALACGQPVSPIADPPNEAADTSLKSFPQVPLDAGRLSVNPEGTYAVAADPGDGKAYVIGLDALAAREIVGLGGRPARAALAGDVAFITLPTQGQVAKVSLATAVVEALLPTCAGPEGLAIHDNLLTIACRDGKLLEFDTTTSQRVRELELEDDLRDVIPLADGSLAVTRFRTAEILVLNAAGGLVQRLSPPGGLETIVAPAVAWETIANRNGDLIMVHQTDTNLALGPVYYSGGSCASVVAPTVSRFVRGADGSFVFNGQTFIRDASGTLDVAQKGDELLVATPGNTFARRQLTNFGFGLDLAKDFGAAPVQRISTEFIGSCHFQDTRRTAGRPLASVDARGAPISVVTVQGGKYAGHALFLSAFPAQIWFLEKPDSLVLNSDDVRNTGLELFQMNVGTGVSCASCHPLGRVDARTWNLPRGPRRTQSLEGGVTASGPLHWDAEFPTFGALVDDILSSRMAAGETFDSARKDGLLAFLDSIPSAPRSQSPDSEAVLRGQTLFDDTTVGCGSCHSGPRFSDNLLHDVGTGGPFVTPSLLGVRHRTPLLHDGCATDLSARFNCGTVDAHGTTSNLSTDQLGDLVSYMKAL